MAKSNRRSGVEIKVEQSDEVYFKGNNALEPTKAAGSTRMMLALILLKLE